MKGRSITYALLGAAFGSLLLCTGEEPREWFGFSIAMFLLSLLFSVFGEDRSPLVIWLSLAYTVAGSWVFIQQFSQP